MTGNVSRRSPIVDPVTCCDDCPFAVARLPRYGSAAFWCSHSALGSESRAVENGEHGVPEWCPLRWGPTLVQLKVRP